MSGYFARLVAKAAPVGAVPRAAPAVAPLEQVVEVESVPVGVAQPAAAALSQAQAPRGAEQPRPSALAPTVQREALSPAAAVPAVPSARSMASTPARGALQAHGPTPMRGIETQARSEKPAPETPSHAQPLTSTRPGIDPVVAGQPTIPAETRGAPQAGPSMPSNVRSMASPDAPAVLPMQTAAHTTPPIEALAMPATIAGSSFDKVDAAASPTIRTAVAAMPLIPSSAPSRGDRSAQPDVRIGTVSLEVRLPPLPAPAARLAPAAPAPAPAAPRFSAQRHYLRWS